MHISVFLLFWNYAKYYIIVNPIGADIYWMQWDVKAISNVLISAMLISAMLCFVRKIDGISGGITVYTSCSSSKCSMSQS